METPILKIENLSHRYSVQWAVKDINLEIAERGIYGLLGSNGAGKSTTMNIMCGVLKPTQGDVQVLGVDLLKYPVEAKKQIGFLPQKPPLHPDLTVEEYLVHCANLHWIPAREVKKAVDRVLDICSIEHFRRRVIRNLSGGYQQRVGIAQALIHNPEFIVLDEPTNGLDPNQIVDIRNLIKNIAQDHTVVLSTHILSEVQAACDHIRMIEQGRVVFAGTVDDFDNYITPDTIWCSFVEAVDCEKLARFEGILGVEELGCNRYRLKFDGNDRITEQIIRQCVQQNLRLSEISLEKTSLDAIFAELSSKNNQK